MTSVMPTTTESSSNPAAGGDTTPSSEKQEKIVKVDKPDEDKFKRDLFEADKQLSALKEKLVLTFLKPPRLDQLYNL